jgi:hypothetical protein
VKIEIELRAIVSQDASTRLPIITSDNPWRLRRLRPFMTDLVVTTAKRFANSVVSFYSLEFLCEEPGKPQSDDG